MATEYKLSYTAQEIDEKLKNGASIKMTTTEEYEKLDKIDENTLYMFTDVDEVEVVQSDWNQTDETAADFIKNKPFGDEVVVILEEQVVTITDEGSEHLNIVRQINNGDAVCIEWNGTAYNCTAMLGGGYILVGNVAIMGGDDTGEPFLMLAIGTMAVFGPLNGAESATVRVSVLEQNKLDTKYFDRHITLYINPSDTTYLYNDTGLIQKTTSEELYALCMKAPIIVAYSVIGLENMQRYYPMEISALNDVNYIETKLGKHYCAEYTAS